jgi:hypothetical protein
LRESGAAQLEANILGFFHERSVDMQGLAPADLVAVAEAALRTARDGALSP